MTTNPENLIENILDIAAELDKTKAKLQLSDILRDAATALLAAEQTKAELDAARKELTILTEGNSATKTLAVAYLESQAMIAQLLTEAQDLASNIGVGTEFAAGQQNVAERIINIMSVPYRKNVMKESRDQTVWPLDRPWGSENNSEPNELAKAFLADAKADLEAAGYTVIEPKQTR